MKILSYGARLSSLPATRRWAAVRPFSGLTGTALISPGRERLIVDARGSLGMRRPAIDAGIRLRLPILAPASTVVTLYAD